jgi:hypothetical protein
MTSRLSILIALVAALVVAVPAHAADTPFSVRYAETLHGNLSAVGNTLMSCPTGASNCAAARSGSPYSNNDFAMSYVDVDGDSSTWDSSSATLSLPAGATVAWAGLYWSADTSGGSGGAADSHSGSRDQVKLKAGAGAYQTVTATPANVLGSTSQPTRYRAFANVTSLVTGSGTYTVANVKAGTGSDRFAGWALFVVYQDSNQALRHVNVYDGLGTVDATHSFSTTIAPFQTPATGSVTTKTGLLSFEGDPGYATETMTLNGAPWSNAVNPANNVFNSTISANGALLSAKSPDYVNQLGMDLDSQNATGLLANSQSSTTLSFTSTQDYYMPSAFFLVSDEAPAVNTGAPAISGTPEAGSTLTADPGDWQGTPTITYTYQWQRCDATGANCVDIPGATGKTYDLTDADVGHTVRVIVVANNDAGASNPASSGASAVVAPPATPAPGSGNGSGSSNGGNGGDGGNGGTDGGGGSPSGASTDAPVAATSDATGEVAGTLLDDTRCQQLAGNGKYRRVKVAGVGTVRLRAYTTGAALQTAPVKVSTEVTGGRAKRVRYQLDGKALSAGRAPRYAGTITPARLGRTGSHTLQALVTGKRGTKKVTLALKTVSCTTLFTAQRWRTTAGAGLRLRVDARRALKQLTFTVPAALLPKQTVSPRTIGFARVWVAGSSSRQRFDLKLPRRGAAAVAAGGKGGPTVRLAGGGVKVTGLPARAAIVEVTLYRVTKLDRATTRKRYTLRAKVNAEGAAAATFTARPLAPR